MRGSQSFEYLSLAAILKTFSSALLKPPLFLAGPSCGQNRMKTRQELLQTNASCLGFWRKFLLEHFFFMLSELRSVPTKIFISRQQQDSKCHSLALRFFVLSFPKLVFLFITVKFSRSPNSPKRTTAGSDFSFPVSLSLKLPEVPKYR